MCVTQESDDPVCFGIRKWVTINLFLSNFPANMPQVSVLLLVLLKANFKKFSISLLGIIMSLSLSFDDASDDGFVERSTEGTFLKKKRKKKEKKKKMKYNKSIFEFE